MGEGPEAITALMGRFRLGDRKAAGELVEMFYPQLRQIAASRMRREGSGHTWQTTVLVNELYLELVKIKALGAGESNSQDEREAFLRLSSHLMRRLLLHHVRPLSKRTEHADMPDDILDESPGQDSLQQIDDTLHGLEQVNPALRTVVELRVFEGLSHEEIAERVGSSVRTVARHWKFARTWLAEAFGESLEPA
jgi:RNA polymerase sigma factor (TIGR02999 family)